MPAGLWFWTPFPVLASAIGLGLLANNWHPFPSYAWREHRDLFSAWFHDETGLIEITTVVFLLVGAVIAARAVRAAFRAGWPWIGRWLLILLAVTVYFAGEEISWGQHFIGWQTPDWFMDLTGNRQEETNLHNINSWFNQKPRGLFAAWVFLGGIVVPIWTARTGRVPDPATSLAYWFWPTRVCTCIAVLAFVVAIPDTALEVFDVPVDHGIRLWLQPTNGSELQEYCFAAFLMLYFASILYRFRQASEFSQPARREVERIRALS
ncbi:MAG: hypothetical protein QNJ94_21320 [Alphaproteobacteria bacterium]|nr:hypothetical protein [Alphaproteobacteria bacterium]